MSLYRPSDLDGRFTYETPPTGPGQIVAGFEPNARIYTLGFFLFDFSAAFHETPAAGLYVLLLDIVPTPGLPAAGTLARLTLGPTTATGQVLGLPQQSAMPEVECWVQTNEGKVKRRMRGFPFDNGLVAAVSSTPGRVTAQPGTQGARFTARGQICG